MGQQDQGTPPRGDRRALARLARCLHLPERQLSAAVNHTTAGTLSRHINGWRIRHACALIKAGQNVTSAMLQSGFNTQSNVHREFLRVTSASPSQWRAAARPQ